MVKRARVITVAWGESYLRELLELTLPAVLAPGNLPALAREFDCDVVLLTEQRLFELVRQHPVYERIARHCPVRLVAIDDLIVAPLYGLALTWAVYRGFQDLGPQVTETALVFIWSDWIPADGSYRSLIRHLRAGARLINAPSYCVVTERVEPVVRSRMDANGVLSIPNREMAELAIRYRHNTIRGKTLNRRLFHMDAIDQFYWLVDSHTLLAHQMPVAVACMVPEVFKTVPQSFFDYGITLELCPTTPPLVLADSDEFLMIELRSEATYSEGLKLGWPSLEQVGRYLATFVTKDHIDLGAHQLVLHSRELPPQLDEAREQLRASVRSVFAQIKQPNSYTRHPFWWPQQALFEVARRDFDTREVVSQWRWGFRASPYTNILLAEVDKIEQAALQRRAAGGAADLGAELGSVLASMGQLEGLFSADLNALRKTIREKLHRWYAPSLALAPSGATPGSATTPRLAARSVASRIRDFINQPHLFHPDRVAASSLLRELKTRPAAAGAPAVVICSDGRELAQRALRASGIEPTLNSVYSPLAAPQEPCGFVVMDLNHADLRLFRPLCRAVLPWIKDGGAILLLHENRRGPLIFDPWTILNVFPPSDQIAVHHTGSLWSHLATGIHDRLRRVMPRVSLAGFNFSAIAALLAAAPVAFVASLLGASRSPAADAALPRSCASMLLVLPVDATLRTDLERW